MSDRRPPGRHRRHGDRPLPSTSAGLSSSEEVYVAEFDLEALTASRSTARLTVAPLPRYPSIARDISIVVDETLPAETVRGTIRAAAPDTLVSVREFDRYQGKGVPEGRVSLSLRLTFRSLERTLILRTSRSERRILNFRYSLGRILPSEQTTIAATVSLP